MKPPVGNQIALIALVLFSAWRPALALPEAAVIEQAISETPAVAAARAQAEQAGALAEQLTAGPYETQLQLRGGQRNLDIPVQDDTSLDEWGASVSRTVRLPAKRRLDLALAEAGQALAAARLKKARMEARLAFVELWVAWENASQLALTSKRLAEETRRLAELEQTKVDAGGERQLFADQFRAEADLAELAALQDDLAAINARTTLVASYPGLDLPAAAGTTTFTDDTVDRLLAREQQVSIDRELVRLTNEQAALNAERAQKNRLPDPTFGLSYGTEFGGLEESIMASVTVPLGGRSRRAGAEAAAAAFRAQQLLSEQVLLDSRRRFETARSEAQLFLRAMPSASRAAEIAQSALNRLERGYEIGAVSISDLVTANVTYRKAERAMQQQRGATNLALARLAVLNDLDGAQPEKR